MRTKREDTLHSRFDKNELSNFVSSLFVSFDLRYEDGHDKISLVAARDAVMMKKSIEQLKISS